MLGYCPKFVEVIQLTENGPARFKVECEKPVSPGYYHCVLHISDREFARKRKGELVWATKS